MNCRRNNLGPKKKKQIKPYVFYLIALLLSIAITIPFWFYQETWAIVLESIGCSGIAASLMALFLFLFDSANKQKQVDLYRTTYIKPIEEEIVGLFQKIMWFDLNKEICDLNWDLNIDEYLKLNFYVYTSKYDTKKKYTIEETLTVMDELSKKYTQSEKNASDTKTRRVFQIIYAHSKYLNIFLNNIDSNKLLLDQIGVISVGDIESLLNYYNLLNLTFNGENGNIGAGINFLARMFKKLQNIYFYDKEVTPTFAGRY